MPATFSLTDQQLQQFKTWAATQDKKAAEKQKRSCPNYGADGGGYNFIFYPSNIGTFVCYYQGSS
jgi:hypothetical protein